MKTKLLFSLIIIILAVGMLSFAKNKRQDDFSHISIGTYPAAHSSPAYSKDSAAPFEWTEEERENVAKAQPALVTAVEKDPNGWRFSLDYLSVNPKFSPGLVGPYWLNQSSKIRTFLLREDSAAAKNGVLICNDVNYPKYKKIDDWTTLIDGMPYAFTIEDDDIIQVHLICVP